MPITASDVESRFEDAAYTLRHALAAHDAENARPMRVVPSAAAISKMEECIDWLRLVDGEDARIIWLKAERVPWRQICVRAGVARQTAWRRWVAALQTIASKLNATEGAKPRARVGGPGRPQRRAGVVVR